MFSENTTTIRAALTSYIVLCGGWGILALMDLFICLRSPGKGFEAGLLASAGVGLLFWLWLRGFKLAISDGRLEYRDGLFRTERINLDEISTVKDEWVGWSFLGRSIRIPRTVVLSKDGRKAIWINTKPFGRRDFYRILEMLPGGKNKKSKDRGF